MLSNFMFLTGFLKIRGRFSERGARLGCAGILTFGLAGCGGGGDGGGVDSPVAQNVDAQTSGLGTAATVQSIGGLVEIQALQGGEGTRFQSSEPFSLTWNLSASAKERGALSLRLTSSTDAVWRVSLLPERGAESDIVADPSCTPTLDVALNEFDDKEALTLHADQFNVEDGCPAPAKILQTLRKIRLTVPDASDRSHSLQIRPFEEP